MFFRTYFCRSQDLDLPEVIAPFYAWRALVLASPLWYPDVSPAVRDQLLSFVERLLDGHDFTPEHIDDLLSNAPSLRAP